MDLEGIILARERQRYAALLSGNVAALEPLLSDRLMFVHANATMDDKASLLEKMAAGSIRYVALTLDDVRVTVLDGATALLAGRLAADLLVRGSPKTVRNLMLSVWVLENDVWRLVAYHPTPIPA